MSGVERVRPWLRPLSWLFGIGVAARGLAYDRGLRGTADAMVPVVSVGNLTTGGTGKTPLVRLIARELHARGVRPAVLLRGYGARGALEIVPSWREAPPEGALARFGDEALEHTRALGDSALVVAHRDRVRGAAIARDTGAEALVLDDGFQHRRLRRDLDIVCLDAACPLGRGGLLPAGDLREPPGALARAHLIMWTRADDVAPDPAIAPGLPWVSWRHAPRPCRRAGSDEPARPARVVLAARVANAESVARGAEEAGLVVAAHRPGPDHGGFDDELLASLERSRDASGADALLITGKDEPRLLAEPRGRALAAMGRVVVLELEVVPLSSTEPLSSALAMLVDRQRESARPR